MTLVQHTVKLRIGKDLVDVQCPPFMSIVYLEMWLAQYRCEHPDSVVVSKSWSSNAAA